MQRGSEHATLRTVLEAAVSNLGKGWVKHSAQGSHCVQTTSLPVSSVSVTGCERGAPMLKWIRYSEFTSVLARPTGAVAGWAFVREYGQRLTARALDRTTIRWSSSRFVKPRPLSMWERWARRAAEVAGQENKKVRKTR